MIVDDDKDNCALLKLILENEGFGVLTAFNGQDALDILKVAKTPDLVLTDMCMPHMNGSEFYSKLKNDIKTKDVPVIVISGLDDIDAKTKNLGAWASLKKPYCIEALTSLINAQLHIIH